MDAMSSKGTANMSCRTNASRSCGTKAQGADQEDDRHPKGFGASTLENPVLQKVSPIAEA
jgi:hypothetical protein